MSSTPRVKRAFTREMLVWSSLEAHPGIAKFLGFYADFEGSKAWLLSPWEPNGNVSEFVRAHELEVPEKLSLVYDTIDALKFLHQLDPPVCHGDIKSANVLVTAEYKARLCDFGLAQLHEDSGFGRLETTTGMKGSIRWCSPEILNGEPRRPTSDVYAWAWLVWEIMTGKVPYEETSVDFAIMSRIFEDTVHKRSPANHAIMRKIFQSPLPQVDEKSRLSDFLHVWELMRRCWNVDPGQRPAARMCKTTVSYLPRCTPTPANVANLIRSAELLENLGELESWKGNPEISFAYLHEALRLYEEQENARGVAGVLRKQAVAAYRISDFSKVRAIATIALEHCRALNDTLGIAEASFYLGSSIYMLDEAGKALPLLRESLEIRLTHGDDIGVVQCLERIADIQRANFAVQDALLTLDEAVTIATRSGDQLGRANALHLVGVTHLEQSDFVKAADAFSEAILITRNIGWESGLSVDLVTMGNLKMRLEAYSDAEGFFQESISIARRIRSRYNLARGLNELGECFRVQSKLKEAVVALEESCSLFQELSQQVDLQLAAAVLVELKSSQGDWNGALLWLDHVISACRSQKEYLEVASHLERKGEILVTLQRYDEAALHFEAAMQTQWEDGHIGFWKRRYVQTYLCAIPKTVMEWECRPALLCDLKKLQRRRPQLFTASLKLPIPIFYRES